MGILLTNAERNHYIDKSPSSPYWSDWVKTNYDPYLEFSNHRPNLLICFGDSWTWGDSLVENLTGSKTDVPNIRLQHVYGRRLADQLDADFVNCAIPGIFNYWIFDRIDILLNHDAERLQDKYNKVYIVVTLTEIGRDLEFDHYVNKFENHYLLTKSATGSELTVAIEKFDFICLKLLQSRLPTNFQLIVGRNFTWTQQLNINILDCLLEKTWVEVLFDAQDFVYNKNVVIMSHGIKHFSDYIVSKNLDTADYKQWFLDTVSAPSLAQLDLLNRSKFNYKKASKHPTAEGHQMWADYIFSQITKGLK